MRALFNNLVVANFLKKENEARADSPQPSMRESYLR